MSGSEPAGRLTAVILAAGVNERLGETMFPKPFLSLTGRDSGPSFVERHVEVLRDHGVDDVVVVVSESVGEGLPPIADCRFVTNPFDTSSTGSTLSLSCALRLGELRADDGLLIMDADIVYERALMSHVVAACDRSRLFISPLTAGDDEEVRVYGNDAETPTLIGKGLDPPMTDGMKLFGESLGVIQVSARDRGFLRSTCEWLVGWPPDRRGYGYSKVRSEHEEVWQYFFAAHRMAITPLPSDLLFSECDTSADYAHVTRDLFDSITARDRARETGSADPLA